MMTDEATPAVETTGLVSWLKLRRNTMARTSAPTNATLRSLAWELTKRRQGDAPYLDAVLLGALRLADRDDETRAALLAEVNRIEGESFDLDALAAPDK